jgi:hypothetical protein
LVDDRCSPREIADLIGLDLLGEVLGDLVLGAPQDERVDRRAQPLRRLVVALLDRASEALLELVERAEQPRRDEVEDAPDLGQAVLDRRAGEGEPTLRASRFAAAAVAESGFLMCCASSRMAYVRSSFARNSSSRRSSA